MGCIIEVGNPPFRINLAENQHTQKMWIEALLHCTKLEIKDLAMILDLPSRTLSKVHQGNLILAGYEAEQLAELFLLTFCD